MKIGIIGAGAAGLSAARQCLKEGYQCDVFEQTGNVGGTWYYTDKTDFDENGLPVHSSMYQGLRTNLPKELMQYEDFPYPDEKMSYIPQNKVLEYMENYAEHFNLFRVIKFYQHVIEVDTTINSNWKVKIKDLKTNSVKEILYDAILICSGHFKDPLIPQIEGLETFEGSCKHSHIYRSTDPYIGRNVLILGAGPSGQDISRLVAEKAGKVFLSHNLRKVQNVSPKVIQKDLIERVNKITVQFSDKTVENVDDIILCTGYKYTFPFLTENCGIKIEDNVVKPLYKMLINIENPTMAFVGIPFGVCPFPLFDIQVKFFLSSLNGHFQLPTKEEMLQDLNKYILGKMKLGVPMRHLYRLCEEQGSYFDDLSQTANIDKVPEVIQNLYVRVRMNRNLNDCFKIVNDKEFMQIG